MSTACQLNQIYLAFYFHWYILTQYWAVWGYFNTGLYCSLSTFLSFTLSFTCPLSLLGLGLPTLMRIPSHCDPTLTLSLTCSWTAASNNCSCHPASSLHGMSSYHSNQPPLPTLRILLYYSIRIYVRSLCLTYKDRSFICCWVTNYLRARSLALALIYLTLLSIIPHSHNAKWKPSIVKQAASISI